MDYSQEQIDILRLYRSDNVGSITFFDLVHHYGSASEAIYHIGDLSKYTKRNKKITIFSQKQAEKELRQLHDLGGEMLFYTMDIFPKLLLEIADPPPLLSLLGNRDLVMQPRKILGIIGARNASSNGLALAKRFGQVMAEHDYIIASGMAIGIDGAAHQGALAHGTIAVLAGGVDHIYPKQHEKLYHDIMDNNGAVISEMPLSMNAQARHFPRRNRIVSGLSLGVLVIEASLKSGSLITARLANEQNREVFAVPASPLTPNGRGCNALIKQGAYLVETPDDILPILDPLAENMLMREQQLIKKQPTKPSLPSKSIESKPISQDKYADLTTKLRQLLSHEATSIEQLMHDCNAPIHDVKTALMALSLSGEVILLAGEQVCLQSDDDAMKRLF